MSIVREKSIYGKKHIYGMEFETKQLFKTLRYSSPQKTERLEYRMQSEHLINNTNVSFLCDARECLNEKLLITFYFREYFSHVLLKTEDFIGLEKYQNLDSICDDYLILAFNYNTFTKKVVQNINYTEGNSMHLKTLFADYEKITNMEFIKEYMESLMKDWEMYFGL